jgi:hypothetical protein
VPANAPRSIGSAMHASVHAGKNASRNVVAAGHARRRPTTASAADAIIASRVATAARTPPGSSATIARNARYARAHDGYTSARTGHA